MVATVSPPQAEAVGFWLGVQSPGLVKCTQRGYHAEGCRGVAKEDFFSAIRGADSLFVRFDARAPQWHSIDSFYRE